MRYDAIYCLVFWYVDVLDFGVKVLEYRTKREETLRLSQPKVLLFSPSSAELLLSNFLFRERVQNSNLSKVNFYFACKGVLNATFSIINHMFCKRHAE